MNRLGISRGAQSVSFVACLNDEIVNLRRAKRFGQQLRTMSARNSFMAFLCACGKHELALRELTPRLVGDYQQWLIDNGVKRNSSSCYMRTLQSVYNKAVAQTQCPDCRQDNPFAKVYRGIAKTRKRAASIDVMQRLCALDIRAGLIGQGHDPRRKTFARLLRRLEFARDLFVFSYCARGMAFVDMAYLRWADVQGGVVRYARRKTGQHMEVAVEPMMQAIIDHYSARIDERHYVFGILPDADDETVYRAYRTALRVYNAHLKMLSAMLGEDVCLTSYVARHSWASNMHELHMPLSVISEGLGHDSELTTRIYIKSLENSVIHKANRAFLNQIFARPFLSQERDKTPMHTAKYT